MERIRNLLPENFEGSPAEPKVAQASKALPVEPGRVVEAGRVLDSKAENVQKTEDVWNNGLALLRQQLDNQIFSAWIEPLSVDAVEFSGKSKENVQITLLAPNKFCRDHVERHYTPAISTALCGVSGASSASVVLKVPSKSSSGPGMAAKTVKRSVVHKKAPLPSKAGLSKKRGRANSKVEAAGSSNLNAEYNFSNFVVGGCNQFAHAVSVRISEQPGYNYNPLFLYGGVGLGKTHLANAVGNAARRRGKKVLLVSSEVFVSELIAALRSNRMPQFKEKFRSLDLLIVDDIQFIIGKERTQEEFFHTFNELYHKRKQIVITSDRLPQELVGLEERLRTRFASGISADLQAPDFETRVAILGKKAEETETVVPNDVVRLIAESIDTNVRELEGALNRLLAISSIQGVPVTENLANEVLSSVNPELSREVTTQDIQNVVIEKYNVGINDLLGKRRTQHIAFARQVAMYLCRRLTGCSYPEIGAIFGGRDHSTVIHANKVVEEKMEKDRALKSEINSLISRLKG